VVVASASLTRRSDRWPACRPATNAPTKLPTKAPASACDGPSFWLHDPASRQAPVRKLANHTSTCLPRPYNLEVRPCAAGPTAASPVRVRLTAGNGRVVHKSKAQSEAPFVLYGPSAVAATAKGPSLPNGVYYLSAKGASNWGRLKFTQNCPCPNGKKGKKGCMK
jgi:hypothetical protein